MVQTSARQIRYAQTANKRSVTAYN